jgi:hypothetical protein
MIFDSIYENRAPVSKTKGVSRLNTRLGFFAYEVRKLQYSRSKSVFLARRSGGNMIPRAELYQLCYDTEMVHYEYVLKFRGEAAMLFYVHHKSCSKHSLDVT